MYYATAGQQATTQTGRPQGQTGAAPGFPPLSGGLARGAPPGFHRAADPSDFPALGAHHQSSYANQTTQQPSTSSSTNQHLHQQQMYMQGGPQHSNGLAPPPPPGIGGSSNGASPGSQHQQQQQQQQQQQLHQGSNGPIGEQPREDFPALGAPGSIIGGLPNPQEAKDRLPPYMRNQVPPSPPSLANGASASNSATPSTNPPLPASGPGLESWGRQSPSNSTALRQPPLEPVVRPSQQILASPVDRWGLSALLYEIKMSTGKDRGTLIFGEDLNDLGLDIANDEPLYPTFVTPWMEPAHITQPVRIEEPYHLPQCYNVVAPPVENKIPNFTEDTLFFAFYSSPGDLLQLQIAEELFTRGWRFHTDLQVWLTSPTVTSVPLDQQSQQGGPNWLRGPFVVFDPRTLARTKTADEFMVDTTLLEQTKPARMYLEEDNARKEGQKSPNGSVVSLQKGLEQYVR